MLLRKEWEEYRMLITAIWKVRTFSGCTTTSVHHSTRAICLDHADSGVCVRFAAVAAYREFAICLAAMLADSRRG